MVTNQGKIEMRDLMSGAGERTPRLGREAREQRGMPPKDAKPWTSNIIISGSFKKTILIFTLALLVLRVPLAEANTPRCNQCYKTVYQTNGNSFQIKHFFQAHTYVNPSCYNITTLEKCSEKGHHYWAGKNIGTPVQKSKGECPSHDDWLCFNSKYITKKEDLIKQKPYDVDLIQEIVVEEK